MVKSNIEGEYGTHDIDDDSDTRFQDLIRHIFSSYQVHVH